MKKRKDRGIIGFLAMIFMLVPIFSGCEKTEEAEAMSYPEATEHLRMVVLGNEPEHGMDELYEQLDALTVPELGCTVRFSFIPWGNERKQLNIAVASGEYDIIPGGNFSDYQVQIAHHAFLDLNPYLYLVPDLVKHYQFYSDDYLEGYQIDGKLYGIPQFGEASLVNDNEGFFYREDLRKEWGCAEITNLETMEEYLYAAKQDPRFQDDALITDNRIWQSLWIMLAGERYLEISSMQETPFVVVAAEDPGTLLNRLETPEFQMILEYLKKWKEAGILEADMLSLSDNEGERGLELMLDERKPCETNVPIWSVTSSHIPSLTQAHPEWEYGFFTYVSQNNKFFMGSTSLSSALYVSSRTKYPETAVKFLEKIHTDQRYYDLLQYGVDGIHYHNVDGAVSYEGIPSADRFRITVAGDALLNRNEVAADPQWAEVVAKTDRWREQALSQAEKNPIDGFDFLPEGLDQELENLDTVKLEYFQPLVCGYYTGPEDLERVNEKLMEAGLTEYIACVQEQIQKELAE